ncbi:hypothetical protein AnigIFM50267_007982 [Aspergillus niger]|nr:hypothetical protein AnigIFM50267_007982 [Aspergillus niger]
MDSSFIVTEHVIQAQYIREYPRTTYPQDAPVKISIKKYTPKTNQNPQEGDITIIGAHGVGFLKELYEPLWEDLLARSKQDGFRIRAIWIADCANQGASGVQNENIMGNETSWFDHARDLLHMINHFREDMPRPIMGVGHSAGGSQLILLSLMHPRLFSSLTLLDPYLIPDNRDANALTLVYLTVTRRDIWSSRKEAEKFIRRALRSWDPRVLDCWARYGFRNLPTAIHPDANKDKGDNEVPVTLTTTKHQEAFTLARANLEGHTQLGLSESETAASLEMVGKAHDALFLPDILGPLLDGQKFYRPESVLAYRVLPHLRPGALFVSGAESGLYEKGHHSEAVKMAGAGFSGSGGQQYSRVKHIVMDKGHHTFPMEMVTQTASCIGLWIAAEGERWRMDEERIAAGWEGLPVKERSTIPEDWKAPLSIWKPVDKRLAKL